MNSEILQGLQLVLHILTVLMLASYYSPNTRYRRVPSIIAATLCASSAALAVELAAHWGKSAPQPLIVLFVFAVFAAIASTRGDVAKLYDALRTARITWWPRQ